MTPIILLVLCGLHGLVVATETCEHFCTLRLSLKGGIRSNMKKMIKHYYLKHFQYYNLICSLIMCKQRDITLIFQALQNINQLFFIQKLARLTFFIKILNTINIRDVLNVSISVFSWRACLHLLGIRLNAVIS